MERRLQRLLLEPIRTRVGEIEARVDYSYTSTSSGIGEQPVVAPDGTTLAPQNFWGAMQSQGAPSIQGDAFATYYDTRTSRANSDYDPDAYYQYAVEFPSGASGGEIWLFDPGFCHVDSDKGVGENWNTGNSYGYKPHQPVSAYYDLYDTQNTTYHSTDDTLVTSSGTTFERLSLRDPNLDVSNPLSAGDCSGESWHNGWWKLADGLAADRTYRIHAYSTDPDSSTDQRNTTALNAFAIWATASNGTPRVYGLGAMEAYVRLPGGRSSEFYLAQIDAEHAGKTMVINLWDPGDTGDLSANLQILRPTSTTYQATDLQLLGEAGVTSLEHVVVQLAQGHERRLGDDQHRRFESLQRLLADHRDPAADRLHGPAPVQRHRHQRGRLVEDPLQHERQHLGQLHRPHHVAGRATWQPCPPGDPVVPRSDPGTTDRGAPTRR